MKFSKLTFLALSSALLCGTGCNTSDDDKIKITCTLYPEYEWINAVIDGVDGVAKPKLLINSSIDFHSYQASVDDIISVGSADLFVYVGGESDEWIEKVDITNKNQKQICLLNVLGEDAKLEEEKEGMQEDEHHHHDHDDEDEDHDHEEGDDHDHEEGEDHDHEEGEDHDHEHEEEYDEHVWNSLINAQKFVKSIAEELGKIDENNKDKYLANANNYNKKLDDLHKEYVAKFVSATHKTLIVADRFPFSYLFSDYGLDFYAAFKGCSAESEASFETVIFLAKKVNDLGLSTILKTTGSDGKIANSVKDNTSSKDQKIASLYSLETKPGKSDLDYINTMKANLDVLVDASK